jgi:uncharacterized protein (AIM24 family)
MQTRIQGTTMPVLDVLLDPNESVYSESGELSWMTGSIQMTTHTQMGGGGGIFGVLKRVAGGGSIFMTEYRAFQYPGEVSFATKVPGHIVPIQLGQGPEYMVHRHGFLCATTQVTIGVGFQQSLGAGIFGGDGFLLQKISGVGTAWLELSGEMIVKNLAPGETLRVHPGHVGAFQRRAVSGGADRAGAGVVADAADFAAGSPDRRVPAPAGSAADGRDRHGRRTAGRNCGIDSERRQVKTVVSD